MMKTIFAFGLIVLVSGCGADGDPLQPRANLGFGIGPGGITPRISLGASNGNARVNLGPGGASIGVSEGPVSIGVGL